jgi:hypothetical protein
MKPQPAALRLARNWQYLTHASSTPPSSFGTQRYFHPTMEKGAKIQPAKRVAGRRQDVWYVADLLISLMRIIYLLPNPFQLSGERERASAKLRWPKTTKRGLFHNPFFHSALTNIAMQDDRQRRCCCISKAAHCQYGSRFLRIQPSPVHPKCCEGGSRQSRLQSIFANKGSTSSKESYCGCIFAVMGAEVESRYRSYHYNWSE